MAIRLARLMLISFIAVSSAILVWYTCSLRITNGRVTIPHERFQEQIDKDMAKITFSEDVRWGPTKRNIRRP